MLKGVEKKLSFQFDIRQLLTLVQDEWEGPCATGLLQTPIAIPAVSERNLTQFMTIEFTNLQVPINQFTVTNLGRHSKYRS